LFLLLTVVSLVSLIAVVIAGYMVLSATASPFPGDWMGQMMGGGGMMGENGIQPPTQTSAAPYFGVVFVVLVAVAIIGIVGLVYFIAFPEIRVAQPLPKPIRRMGAESVPKVQAPEKVVMAEKAVSPFESVLKTLTEDERKVIQVLTAHEGKYLQKYIRKDAGLSRLQTHRIVARLAERGIVTLEKTGNTNSVLLADWLK
jgi:uncharacterized membrane protein